MEGMGTGIRVVIGIGMGITVAGQLAVVTTALSRLVFEALTMQRFRPVRRFNHCR